jgi:hypothetical protein
LKVLDRGHVRRDKVVLVPKNGIQKPEQDPTAGAHEPGSLRSKRGGVARGQELSGIRRLAQGRRPFMQLIPLGRSAAPSAAALRP